jgi:putative MATE family efflux protein
MRTPIDVRKGPLAPTLIKLSLPMLAGHLFNLAYNLADTFFISQINPNDEWLIGATGLVWPIFFTFMAVMFGISTGVSSLVARAIGAGRTDDLDRTAESGLFLAVAGGIGFLVLLYPLAEPILRLFGGHDQLLVYGLEYLYWILPVAPFMLLSAVFNGILQGEGRPQHMMVSMIIGTVVNLILDPVLIFVVGMGISGAALATVIGNVLGFLYLLVVFLKTQSQVKIHWKIAHISMPVVGEIVRVGLPQMLSNLLASLSFIFYNRIMIDLVPIIMSSFTLYSRLEQIALSPIWALMSGLAAVAGQAAGARDIKRMRAASWTATLIGLVVSGPLLLGYVLVSPLLFRIFQSNAGVLEYASRIAPWMAGAAAISIPIFVINNVMTSAGFSIRSLVLTAVRIYALSVPACALGAYVIGRNVSSVMFALVIASGLALALNLLAQRDFFVRLLSGRLQIRLPAQQGGAPV